MLPGSPNHPSLSAMRWRLLQPPHRATTTPFWYESLLAIFIDLVFHTLHVKITARSCLGEIFRLEVSLTLKLDSDVRTEASAGVVLESCWSWVSVAILLTPVTVKRDLSPRVAGGGNENPAMTGVSRSMLN